MKTPRKQFNELPLPAGWKTPPEGFLYVGRPEGISKTPDDWLCWDCKLSGPQKWSIGRRWSFHPDHYYAAPAHLVRRLSTQKRTARKVAAVTKPRKPYDEKPLPVGMAPPPDGFVYVGMGVSGIKPFACNTNGSWETSRERKESFGYSAVHYAAPAELCNRLPPPPDASDGHVKLTEPKPVEPDEGRFEVVMGGICFGGFNTADQAYESAEKMARDKPDKVVYVYQLRAKFTASVNVNRTDY